MLKLIMPAIILILIAKTSFAQKKDTVGLNVPFTNGAVVYERVFDAPGKTKADLFNKGHLWFVARYKNPDAIQILDDSAGTIVGNGRETIRFKKNLLEEGENKVDISLQMDFKDGRYRCRIFNIKIRNPYTDNGVLATADDLMNNLVGNKGNPVALNKADSKRVLKSLSNTINGVMLSVKQSISQNDDF